MAATDYHNQCGGTRYRMVLGPVSVVGEVPTYVELEQGGLVHYSPGSPGARTLTQCWRNWRDLICDASEKHGVPASWILAIMAAETGFLAGDPEAQRQAQSPAGALGLMQMMPQYFGHLGDLTDPEISIDGGTAFLATLLRQTGGDLPEMSARYNAGSIRCDPDQPNPWGWVINDDYTGKVVRFANTPLEPEPAGPALLVLGVALALGGVLLLRGA